MSTSSSETDHDLQLTPLDIKRAADEGVLSHTDAEKLVEWGYAQRFNQALPSQIKRPTVEDHKGLNLVTVAYYFGALIMISACGWFLGSQWQALGSGGILLTVLIYIAVTASLGAYLRSKEYLVGGGLLVTVAVSLVPLLVYTIEDLAGFWPSSDPGKYESFYPRIHGSWILMEFATIAAALIALRFVRFGFLTAPLAFSLWFLSMDLAAYLKGVNDLDWDARKKMSIIVGLITIVVGFLLDRLIKHQDRAARGEDFAFWCYLFGLIAFWGALSLMDSNSELNKFFYLLINLALVGVAIKLRRATFLVFGAIGVHCYLGHLAYEIFKDSVLFPFALALLGLSLILGTVWAQKRMKSLTTANASS